jgi:hypothetical protein
MGFFIDVPTWYGEWRALNVATLLQEECEDEIHTPEMGTWECAETPETSKFDYKGQNTLHWSIIYIIGKLSKRRCRKWARMNHLDIWNTSYGKKKAGSQIVNLIPDHQKSGIDPTSRRAGGVRHAIGKLSTRATSLFQTSS